MFKIELRKCPNYILNLEYTCQQIEDWKKEDWKQYFVVLIKKDFESIHQQFTYMFQIYSSLIINMITLLSSMYEVIEKEIILLIILK